MVAPPSKRSLFTRSKFFDARFGDGLFYWGTMAFAGLVLVLVVALGYQLVVASKPTFDKFGFDFLSSSTWKSADDPIAPDTYGAWPYIFGTLYSSIIALLLAVPIGVGTAVFLAELAPRWMRNPVSFLIELLAAVPSVVYGLWGVLVMVPWLREIQGWLADNAADWPVVGRLFEGTPQGFSMMAGGLILAIMILPFITAVSREVIKAVPPIQREAAFGLGATHWEAIKGPILRAARSGIIGAVILGLARALGETMAITMVIGNSKTGVSLLEPGATLSSKIANEFPEASSTSELLPALISLALVLFVITIVVNALARILIWNMSRSMRGIRS